MHGPEKSDPPIVAGKSANKAAPAAAEPMERRGGIEGKAELQSTVRTRSRVAVSQAQDRLRQAVARNKKERLTALLHHVSLDTLRWAFFETPTRFRIEVSDRREPAKRVVSVLALQGLSWKLVDVYYRAPS